MPPRLPENQRDRDALADLTWAVLYAAKIRDNLKGLPTVFRKSRTGPALTERAALLRQQLHSASDTVDALRKMSGLGPPRPNRS